LPTWGPGQLSVREDPKIHGTDAERKLFTTENPAWKKTATKFAESGVGVDLFIAAPGGTYMDVATIGKSNYTLLDMQPTDSGNRTCLWPYWR
jgi:protein transport protein SEC24